jgi:hypothetical protein
VTQHPQLARNPFCNVKGCDQPLAFYPVVKVWARGYPTTSAPLVVEVGMSLCAAHKDRFTADDLPDLERLVREVCERYRLKEPDMDTLRLEMVAVA